MVLFMPEGGVPWRTRAQISLEKEILDWVDLKVKDKTFASRSHAVQYALKQLMNKEERTKKPITII